MPYTIVRNDIVDMDVDIIVNSAGSLYSSIGGVEASIMDVGGEKLLNERRGLGNIPISQARYTSAPNLPSKYVIHTRGPIYERSENPERELREAYRNSLKLALDLKADSIAIPLISSGSYGYPKKKALLVAQEEILKFLENNELMIYLVVYDKKSFTISNDFLKNIRQYINTSMVYQKDRKLRSMRAPRELDDELFEVHAIKKKTSLTSRIKGIGDGFTETLLKLIDNTGQRDSVVYKKANIDRKLFSKIRNNPHYKPSKNTILAFAIALELTIGETNNLLSKAGYTLSESILFDVIITYCIENEKYNIYYVNNHLYVYDQELLGSQ